MMNKLDEIRAALVSALGAFEHNNAIDWHDLDKAIAALDSLGSESAREIVGEIAVIISAQAPSFKDLCKEQDQAAAMLEAWDLARRAKEGKDGN